MKKRLVVGVALGIASLVTGSASAHVVVKPSDALTGAFQDFSVNVPNEKDMPVTIVKLLVPGSVQEVTPTVKPGWQIDVEKDGQAGTAKVKSITWSVGTIPVGLRDDFGFSAKTPDKATDIQWKAYQTYEGGQVISWDQKPAANETDDDSAVNGPYSVTKVTAKPVTTQDASSNDDQANTNNQARAISIVALAVSVVAFSIATRKNKK
jgi:uncharacterized protein YcnI